MTRTPNHPILIRPVEGSRLGELFFSRVNSIPKTKTFLFTSLAISAANISVVVGCFALILDYYGF
jgi:hypothetical protein